MSGSGAGGKWMASSVKKKDITELREAGYLAKEITHRLPTKGQIVPTPEPHERVVVSYTFRPRVGVSTSPIRPRADVLIWVGLPRSGPQLRPQYLSILSLSTRPSPHLAS